jgi:hypothetical protein
MAASREHMGAACNVTAAFHDEMGGCHERTGKSGNGMGARHKLFVRS